MASSRPEMADPFAMQLALSRVHARLVPMRRAESGGYELDPSASGWFELPSGRGFAGYGLGRALRMLLDVLRGLTALHDTFTATGNAFAHGEVALPQLRVDEEGVCRLVPLTPRHYSGAAYAPEALGHVAPERLLGEGVDARSDVFSAGVLLWEALAGRRLFSESTGEAIIDRLMGEKLQMPQLPPELAWAIPLKSVVARALAVDPYQRYADCAELSTAITIVARERVASHTEIANFFGSTSRSGSSLTPAVSLRPVPSQSSTFPAVELPRNAAPASQRTHHSTLAPLGVSRSFTPAPGRLRSLTPLPMKAIELPVVEAHEITPASREDSAIAALLASRIDDGDTDEVATMLMLREELTPEELEQPAERSWNDSGIELAPPLGAPPVPPRRGSSALWLTLGLLALVGAAAALGFAFAKSANEAATAPSPNATEREESASARHDRPGIPMSAVATPHEAAPGGEAEGKPVKDAVVPRSSSTSKPRAPVTKGDPRDYGI